MVHYLENDLSAHVCLALEELPEALFVEPAGSIAADERSDGGFVAPGQQKDFLG